MRNFIKSLENDASDSVDDLDQLISLAAGYFENLFTSEIMDPYKKFIDKVDPSTYEEMNERLGTSFTREEVKKPYLI
jgi:hypothetical protein